MTGKVIKKMEDKGFGFIKGDDGRDFFFHRSGLKNIKFEEIGIGREVTFEDSEGPKGLKAEDIYV